jgi:hypothetical protein
MKQLFKKLFAFLGALCVLAASPVLFGQESKPAPADLPTVDDLLNVPRQSPRKGEPGVLDRPVEDEVSTEPFQRAVEGMRDAAGRLGEHQDAGIETQRVQEQVVKRLDMLISQMRKQQQKQKQQARKQDSGSQQQQQQQADKKNEQSTQAAVNETNPELANREKPKSELLADQPYQENFKEWGKLPDRLRDALMDGFHEKFSSLYQKLTERYYLRLGEEGP